jgi:hypothetical protein
MLTAARREQLREERRRLAALLAHRRDIARRIDAGEPAWDVMFGPATLLFWAFPCWSAPRGLILSDPDPVGLLAQMRQAETIHGGNSYAVVARCRLQPLAATDLRRSGGDFAADAARPREAIVDGRSWSVEGRRGGPADTDSVAPWPEEGPVRET